MFTLVWCNKRNTVLSIHAIHWCIQLVHPHMSWLPCFGHSSASWHLLSWHVMICAFHESHPNSHSIVSMVVRPLHSFHANPVHVFHAFIFIHFIASACSIQFICMSWYIASWVSKPCSFHSSSWRIGSLHWIPFHVLPVLFMFMHFHDMFMYGLHFIHVMRPLILWMMSIPSLNHQPAINLYVSLQ